MNTSSKTRLLSSTVVAGLAAFGLMTVSPSLAMAQSSTSTSAQTDQDDRDATDVEEVVIVGSRIKQDVYNSASPVQIITRDESTLAGLASTTEILQGTAVTGGTSQINNLYSGFVVDGGPGANTISLRGLGPTRTLVLLNGRRVAPAGSRGSVGSADLNVLPSALIERVEILRDGASSIYGSDAVAGVINIVTRTDLDGFEVEGQYNATTDADGEGDESRISISGGTHGDRWHVIGSLERYEREELTLGARDFARCPTQGFTDGSDTIDPLTGKSKCFSIDNGGVTINTLGTGNVTSDARVALVGVRALPGLVGANGVPAIFNTNGGYYNRFRPNSAVTTGLSGFEGVGGAYLDNPDINLAEGFLALSTDIRDTRDPDQLKQSLFSPVQVTTAYLAGGYDLHALGDAELYSETLINRRESQQTGYRQLTLDYAVGSPLVPANIAALPSFSGATVLTPGRRVQARAFIGFGNDESEQTVDFAKQVIGIRGNLPFAEWTYDAYASYTRSKSEYTSQQFLTNLLARSLDVVAAPVGTNPSLIRNGLTCRINTTDPTAGCISAPPLNSQTLAGELPQDWVNYVFRPVTGTTEYIEKVASIGVGGPIYTLPAGQIQVFLGAEYREASIDDTPGYDSQTDNTYNFSTAAITRGDDSVTEVYGEVEVPLLADLPFIDKLTFTGSGRYTDYQSYGDDTTYKAGLVYSPISWVSLRASYGTSYRAPALFEQFLGATSGFLAASTDVCSELSATDSPTVIANCRTEVPNSFVQNNGVAVVGVGGAAAGLAAETSKNFTGGVVVSPPLPSGWGDLSVAVDYYEITVDNGVSQAGAAGILAACYGQSAADFAADRGFCAFVSRNPTTNALTVINNYVNIATDFIKGIDYNLRYRNDDIGPGRFLANLQVTQYLERYNQIFPTDPIYDLVGTVNSPEFTATADLSYSWDDWRVRYGVEWINASSDRDYLIQSQGIDYTQFGYDVSVDQYFMHSVSAQYSFNDDTVITAGVRNLTNEDPPTLTGAYAGGVGNSPLYSGYDFIGRNIFLNVSKKF